MTASSLPPNPVDINNSASGPVLVADDMQPDSPSELTSSGPSAVTQAPPTLVALDGGYADTPSRIDTPPQVIPQMGPPVANPTNVPLMIQGVVFTLLPFGFANNPVMFEQNRMFIWILFALGCGLIASQVPGVDELNLPKIKLWKFEFAARGWVAVSIMVVMAFVNPSKSILNIASSTINSGKPVITKLLTPTADTAETASDKTADEPSEDKPKAPPLVMAMMPSQETPAKAPKALETETTPLETTTATTPAVEPEALPPLQQVSYKDRIILPTIQWQPMGLALKQGDSLSINQVRGTWSLSDSAHGNYPMVEAMGGEQALKSPNAAADTAKSFIMPSAPPAALIGKVGLNGTPFVVGKALDNYVVSSSGGELYLSINDGAPVGTPGFWDNAGQMTANITVLTPAVSASLHP
jgi:hypothetical protein